ncbi:hypothetical protein AAHA92_31795 [Salvia divinorum]|uniref:Mitochondrial import inner membrane translocase subunit TIM50 n=1 Tax=Salvia divinorum TaxID=28513 RepID=A0ABD1FIK3_SALDI
MSLAQGKNSIVVNKEIVEEGKEMITYQRRKRRKKTGLSDLPRSDLESFSEGVDLSVGNVRQITGKSDDTSGNGDTDMHALMTGNSEVLDVASTKTDADELPGVASSSGACRKDFPVHLGIKDQCLSTHATSKSKSCDDCMIVSNRLEELHDEAKEIASVVDGDPLYHEEQSVASHDDLSLDDTQGVSRESINVEADRAFAGHMQKKLLVLDLNGLLVDISSYIPYNYDPDAIIMKKAVFRRPHCDDFLTFCFQKFNVGFWTSRTKRNMEPLLDFLLGYNKTRLLFHWDQSHCTDSGYYTIDKKNKPLLLKNLKKLWDKCEPGLPWETGVYNESNTLLLDDTPYKALTNPRYTAVFPYSYQFRDVRDNSLGPGGDLRVYLEGLAEAENVQEYVKQNPFGQRPITEKNLSWGYYRKVIAANSTPPRGTDTGSHQS